MTLKTRNRLFVVLLGISLLCIVAAAVALLTAFTHHAIVPPTAYRVPSFTARLPLAGYHFSATMLAIAVLVLYVPVVLALLLLAFENTQTSELLFFATFLLGCLCEGSRLLIPLFALGESFSQLQLFMGRALFVGRMLAPLSFVGAAILSDSDQRQDLERNVLIIIAAAILTALAVPLNTAQVTTACTITWGFPRLFTAMRALFVVTAVVSFWLNGWRHDTAELRHIALASLLVLCGYQLLACADNFVFLIIGLALLSMGTYLLLTKLHKLYMWK